MTFGGDRLAQAHGAARVSDGTSQTLFVAESYQTGVTCADVDGDGVAGVILLEFRMQDVRTGELVAVSVSPVDGDIDDGERHLVVIRIGDTAFTGWSSFYRSL